MRHKPKAYLKMMHICIIIQIVKVREKLMLLTKIIKLIFTKDSP